MKAVVYEQYGDPSVLKVMDVPKPTIGPTDVLINVKASGINPVDTYFRKGIRQVEQFPHIPHFDVAGEIVEIGSDIQNWKVGDRVWATNIKGASAEYALIPEHLLFPLPKSVSYEEGAALAMTFMTAHLSLFDRGRLQKGETVLIYGGSGAVGHAAIQLAKRAGATVITTAGDREKGEIAKQAGADQVIFYKEESVVDAVGKATNGQGVPLILDMSLSENMAQDFDVLTTGGRIVAIGSPVDNTPPLLWRQLNMKHASLIGVLVFTAPKNVLRQAGKEIAEGFEQGELSAYIGKVFPIDEAAHAHRALEAKTYQGRIILSHED
ncbi:NADPH:quinone reductase [Halalkalibacterium halodurans]|uniref:NADPH:quinone reductase n=1 Tax=Halalkalibacterium halodurans TaxID=86665 RepID=UPI002E23A593|nr:NADPH:quinone reductase [Halalkalibacterium halodurans]MED4162077.1 NADPH:quinone reductase [Halalkalibacterium halodurans]